VSTVRELYDRELSRLGHHVDQAQLKAVERLDDLRSRLLSARRSPGFLAGLFQGRKGVAPERGLYLWGGVGRGKTWIMDLFFQSLPFKNKQRSHFHRFMHAVHEDLAKLKEQSDPLEIVAERIAKRTRVLCFDEFFVSDIADAMVLGTLFDGLFRRGVTLVATSNVPPNGLYKEGLQRARFLPAIRQLEEHTEVLQVDGGIDHRLRVLEGASTWLDAGAADTDSRLASLFEAIAGHPGQPDQTIVIEHRRVHARRAAEDVVWFDFQQVCDGPRGQADYIELARCYHTVFVSNIPVLDGEHENQARRFIALVDEFYDRAVKLILSARAPLPGLYRGSRLTFEFERTSSRLIEMQSQDYLARPHKP
jgi:cell division protein ZapE